MDPATDCTKQVFEATLTAQLTEMTRQKRAVALLATGMLLGALLMLVVLALILPREPEGWR